MNKHLAVIENTLYFAVENIIQSQFFKQNRWQGELCPDVQWAEKYDYCRVEEEDFLAEIEVNERQQEADALFREGQGV